MTSRTHSRAYLESLLQPPLSSGTIGPRPATLTRTASSLGLASNDINNYKPTKSSGLAVEDGGNQEEEFTELQIKDGDNVDEMAAIPAAVTKTVFLGSASDADDDADPSTFLRIHTTPSKSVQSSISTFQSVQVILNLLDDEDLDDEDRIEQVRFTLAARLHEVEGAPTVSITAVA